MGKIRRRMHGEGSRRRRRVMWVCGACVLYRSGGKRFGKCGNGRWGIKNVTGEMCGEMYGEMCVREQAADMVQVKTFPKGNVRSDMSVNECVLIFRRNNSARQPRTLIVGPDGAKCRASAVCGCRRCRMGEYDWLTDLNVR